MISTPMGAARLGHIRPTYVLRSLSSAISWYSGMMMDSMGTIIPAVIRRKMAVRPLNFNFEMA